jgi:hypothetical protein
MTKIQKIWLGINILLIIFIPIILFLQGENVYIEKQNIVFGGLIIEIIGLIGLIYYNKKYNNKKYKNLISGALILITFVVSFVLYVLLSLSHGIGF